jgi:hypothetical protein
MNETFALTNIAPQVGAGFNRHCMLSIPTLGVKGWTIDDVPNLIPRLGLP